MANLEGIKQYISCTGKSKLEDRYDISLDELMLLRKAAQQDIQNLHLVFLFGRAKGYRMAKNEMKKAGEWA